MTEMPAKTPNPMGNTCSFFPGMANGAGDVLAFSAAAVPDDAAPAEVTEVALGVPLEDDASPVDEEAAEVDEELEAVSLADDADNEAETEVTGSTEIAAEDEVDAVDDAVESVDEDVDVAVEEESVVVAVTDVLVADEESVDETDDPTRATVHCLTSRT